jgi:hypothetical protein
MEPAVSGLGTSKCKFPKGSAVAVNERSQMEKRLAIVGWREN